MNNIKILFILLLSNLSLFSQKDTINTKYWIINKPKGIDYIKYSSVLISGTCEGIRESEKFYPYNFPDSSWNPDSTWTNKYNNLFGSLYSDKYHTVGGIRTISNLTYIGCVSIKFYNKKFNKKQLIINVGKELLLNFIIYNGSKTLTMNYFKYK